MTETELYVSTALSEFRKGNDGDAVYHPLYKAWKSFVFDPTQLQDIQNEKDFSIGMMMLLSYGTIHDIDDAQQIASVAYLFIGKALEKNPRDINLYKNRIILIEDNKEAFGYTVSSIVDGNECTLNSIMSMSLNPFKSRDAMFKMPYSDVCKSPILLSIDVLKKLKANIEEKISNDFFHNKGPMEIIKEGSKLHSDVTSYLSEKVLYNEDLDF